MKKKIIFVILFIFLISLCAGLYYFNTKILPTIVKEKIIAGLSSLTSGKVTIEKIRFNIFRGIVITNLVLFEKDNPDNQLCSVKDGSATFLIFPFFKEKKIIVPSLTLDSMTVSLMRHKDNSLNIGYLLEKFKQSKGSSNRIPFFVLKSIKLTNSAVIFKDESFQTLLTLTLRIKSLIGKLSWNKVTVETSAELLREDKKTLLQAKGAYLFANQSINGDFSIKDLDLKTYNEYLQGLPFVLETGQLSQAQGEVSIDLKENIYQCSLNLESFLFSLTQPALIQGKIEKSSFDVISDKKIAKLSAVLNISEGNAQKDKLNVSKLKGKIDIKAEIPIEKIENLKPSYEGSAEIKSGEVSGIATIDKISEISSNLKFKNSDIVIEDVLAKILDTPITAKGDLKEKVLNLNVSGNFDLKKFLPLITSEITLPPYELSGTTQLNIHFISDFSKAPPSFFASGEASLAKVYLELLKNNLKFTTEDGVLRFDTQNESLEWHFDAIRFLTENYSFNGNLKGFQTPAIHAMTTSKDLKILTDLIKEGQLLKLSSLNGKFKNSEVYLKGRLDLAEENCNLTGSVILDLGNLGDLLPQGRQVLEKIKPEGRCYLVLEASGPLKDYRLWNIKTAGKSRSIRCYGLQFQNAELDYTQIKHEGYIDSLSFDAYEGKGLIKGRLDLAGKNFSYSLRSTLENINLGILKFDTPLKDKTFFGVLSANISCRGEGVNANSLKGSGALVIKNGNLWEFNPLKGLGSFLFIPRFGNIVFTNAQGDFIIQDSSVSTDNLELLGPEIGLIVEGKISFKGDLDFLVNTQVNQPGPGQGEEEKGDVGEVISQAGSLTSIKITGTVKEPKYKLQPIAENIMKKLGDIFSNIVP